MRAIVYTEYGPPDVLKLKTIQTPTPKDDEVLIRVRATSVNYGDITARNFKNIPARDFNMSMALWLPSRVMFGWNKPKKQILGSEFSGVVEQVGKSTRRFKGGDEVFGYRGANMGANAEYLCVPEKSQVALKPVNLSFQEAAAVPYGAITALNLLRAANIQKGQKVLINGASGGIGSAALQLAKDQGAVVTGVCSTPRMGLVRSLGADHVVDYTREDFTRRGEMYDLVFDILGRSSFAKSKNVLNPGGRYLLASFKTKQLLEMVWTKVRGGKRVICAISAEKPDDLLAVKQLAEEGKIRSIIDRAFPMEQTREAHRYVEEGHKKGSVVIVQ
jgi:NADPH:quinone reductase-like Zn-dependent oxidoreductase